MNTTKLRSDRRDDSHQYDGDGVRMRSKLNGASDWTNFIVCPITGELLAEYTLISSTFTMKSVNTWGIGLISTNREGTKRYFHFDGVGSTVALTQADGAETDTYVYSAFGVLESSTGSSVNPFRYIGQFGYYDDTSRGSNSGFPLLGVRYYSPNWGRFVSWDPVASSNLYCYCDNVPQTNTDPTGMDCNMLVDWRCTIAGTPGFQIWCIACLRRIYPRGQEAGRRSGLPGERTEGPADAFRHCWASCVAVRECGCCCAHVIDIRESPFSKAGLMDLWNNQVGRDISSGDGSCWDLCWLAYRRGKLITQSGTRPRSGPGTRKYD